MNDVQIILLPVECAIESMTERAEQFRTEIYSDPPSKNKLQSLLTGTLATSELHGNVSHSSDVYSCARWTDEVL